MTHRRFSCGFLAVASLLLVLTAAAQARAQAPTPPPDPGASVGTAATTTLTPEQKFAMIIGRLDGIDKTLKDMDTRLKKLEDATPKAAVGSGAGKTEQNGAGVSYVWAPSGYVLVPAYMGYTGPACGACSAPVKRRPLLGCCR